MSIPRFPTVVIYSGDTIPFGSFAFTTPAPANVPIDYSAYTFTAQWRTAPDAVEYFQLQVDQTQSAVGVITVYMLPAQTVQVTSRGVWDLQGVNGALVKTFGQGATTFELDVTR